jgi:type II restriction enzyme
LLAHDKLFLIETNYYSGGGSKLKSTAGEYQNDFMRWHNDGHYFIWVTDGKGWFTTLKPLHDAFNKIDILLNLDMIQNGLMVDYIRHFM